MLLLKQIKVSYTLSHSFTRTPILFIKLHTINNIYKQNIYEILKSIKNYIL